MPSAADPIPILKHAAVQAAQRCSYVADRVTIAGADGACTTVVIAPSELVQFLTSDLGGVDAEGSLRLACRVLVALDAKQLPPVKNSLAAARAKVADNGRLNTTLRVLREFGLIQASTDDA